MMDPLLLQYCEDLLQGRTAGTDLLLSRLDALRIALPSDPHLNLHPLNISDHMRLVLYLAPPSVSWLFACDSAEHVMPIWYASFPQDHRPVDIINTRRSWLRGKCSDEQVLKARDIACSVLSVGSAIFSTLSVGASVFACISTNRHHWEASWAAAKHAVSAVVLFAPHHPTEKHTSEEARQMELEWQRKCLADHLGKEGRKG